MTDVFDGNRKALDRDARPPAESGEDALAESEAAPLSFVVDQDGSIRHFLSLILHGAGVDTEEFADGAAVRTAMRRRNPDLIFINVGLESADAIETVVALGKRGYFGFVQLMSSRGSAVLEHVKSIGEEHIKCCRC